MMRPRVMHPIAACLALALTLVMAVGASLRPASAQTAPADPAPATLVADEIYITSDRKLVAEGNVEAYQDGARMTAQRVVYDRATGRLSVDGPITIEDGGNVTIYASAAQMDDGFRNGLLSGARLVFNQQLQMAALQINRVGGRYNQLYKTAVTSCQVCKDGRPPLWQIRARRVIHDEVEQQIFFEDARFLILNVPVFYFPALRVPDPSLERANGFLIPSIRTTSQLGTGIKVPYFFKLGDHADLTLSPYLSPDTRTLEYRYRQAFRRGRIAFEGAFTEDDLKPDNPRGYIFGEGVFDLQNDFMLNFQIETTSDDAYLRDYGITDDDRLESQIALTRTRRDSFLGASAIHYKSLRDDDTSDQVPTLVGDVAYERRFFPSLIGGELRTTALAHAHRRESNEDMLGRDVARGTAGLNYLRTWISTSGLKTEIDLGIAFDIFDIQDDSDFPDTVVRTTPATAVTFRYPMSKQTSAGTHYLEPIVQLAWSEVIGGEVPDDESRYVEFDEGNLLALSRFPAEDEREEGLRLAYGLNWSLFSNRGWDASATIGQIIRTTNENDFTHTSGLDGTQSDLLVSGQVSLRDELTITARSLFDADFGVAKAEVRGDWFNDRVNLSTSYLWLDNDDAEDRPTPTSEVWFDSRYFVNPNWTASANWRYDIADTRSTEAGVGLTWRNECVEVDVTIRRRFTSSTTVEPSTDFGFTIALLGFSAASGAERYARSCS